MKHGFIKAKCFSPEMRVADVKFNTAKIIQAVWDAHEHGVKVLALPELCVSGASCGDLFLQRTLINACESAIDDIRASSADKDLIFFVGAPLYNGASLYNCAVAISNGKILGVVPKSRLTNYASSNEPRYFCEYGSESEIVISGNAYPFGCELIFECASLPELKIGVEFAHELFLPASSAQELCLSGATVIACLGASSEIIGAEEKRELMVKASSSALKCAYLIANASEDESTTDCIYASHNIICENGKILAQSAPFATKTGDTVSEIDVQALEIERSKSSAFKSMSCVPDTSVLFNLKVEKTHLTRKIDAHPFICEGDNKRYEKILTIQSHALAKRLIASHSRSAVLGISGGLDSTLALLVTVRACEYIGWDKSSIYAITMPCFGTSQRTKSNATVLCEELGVSLKEIDIFDAVRVHFKDIGHDEGNHNVTYENAQARERTQILMDFSNDVGGLVVGTGDLSEIALGWSTYNADHMSMYNPNCDIPKTLVRHLVNYEAKRISGKAGAVLEDILDTPVSPELLPPDESGQIEQKTEDLVGPYALHDFFLYNFVRRGFAPSKIYRLARLAFEGEFDRETIYKWLEVFIKRFFTQQFKRSCSPDGVKVGSLALSPRGELIMPSDATYWVWLDELNNNKDY